jgi:hypothetical protein
VRTSETTADLMKALVGCQAKFPKILKSKTAEVPTKSGGRYSYSYADLADVLEAVRPVLAEHKIAFVQAIDVDDDTGHMLLRTRLAHESGQWIDTHYPLPTGSSAQEMGSAVTYARRYSLCSLVGITAEDDDDGQQAAPSPRTTGRARTQAPQSAPVAAPLPIEDEKEAAEPQGELLDRAEMIKLRKQIRVGRPDHPAVLDGSIGSMTLEQLKGIAQ